MTEFPFSSESVAQLRVVFQALREHHTWLVGKDEVTAKHIREQLEAKNLGRLTETWDKNCADNPSLVEKIPYCYILEVEETLIPGLWANRDDASSCQNGERPVDDPRNLQHLDIPKLIAKARRKVMDLFKPAPPTKLEDYREMHITEFLDATENAITKAQDQKVMELMDRRNREVKRWQRTPGVVSAEEIGTSDAP
ncbi:hypothetical protein B0T18DRAFT_457085 [Schizothecium vesticola]|uniref:Uncharacterized protein n=1 Tax=Schizothecium vesticola TaxID=314040 RepID=A0AA40F5U2_9PEZI|nr:hypothetical protein B0T18DRAFT_457085 [Schizothecium vesticola]